jgi:hypothetical protein
MTPRIFVGTMYSGESEYHESREKILNQSDVSVEHHVIQGLREFEAHNELWSAWNSRKDRFDLFIKVDADTIIDDTRMFSKIYSEFRNNPRLTGMQIPLHDYFTNDLIFGLNCFSPRVVFVPASSRLHADHADRGHDQVMKGNSVLHLTPAGRHCADPTMQQSFHYGLHRMKKNQTETIRKVCNAWRSLGGDGRLFALYGAECAITQGVDHDYSAASFETAYRNASQNPHDEVRIESVIKRLGIS